MPESTSTTSAASHPRLAAMCWAVRRSGSPANWRWLARHPDRAFLEHELPAMAEESILSVYWRQTPESAEQRQPATTGPIDLWQARRRLGLAQEASWLLAELPDFWRVVLDLSSSRVEELANFVGIELLAHAAARKLEGMDTPSLKAALGEGGSMPVRLRRRELESTASMPPGVSEAWLPAWSRRVAARPGARHARWLGLSAMASLLADLPAAPRRFAPRHARSDLFAVLGASRHRFRWSAVQRQALELCLLDRLASLGAQDAGGRS